MWQLRGYREIPVAEPVTAVRGLYRDSGALRGATSEATVLKVFREEGDHGKEKVPDLR